MRTAFGYLRWTPDVFWSATLTELLAAIDGLNEVARARSGKPAKMEPPSSDELARLLAKYGKA